MTDTTTGAGRRVPGGTVWLFTPHPDAPAELRDALLDWARANGLDPERVIGSDGIKVDLVDQVIRYQEVAAPGDPDAYPGGGNSVWKRAVVAPLLVEPPAVLRRPPVGWARAAAVVVPSHAPASYDWAAYERTCAPDRQLDGSGDLALFLGGSEDSFIGKLLALLDKARGNPERIAALELGFPREVTAWRVWRATMDPTPTAADLCAELTLRGELDRVRKQAEDAYAAHLRRGAGHE